MLYNKFCCRTNTVFMLIIDMNYKFVIIYITNFAVTCSISAESLGKSNYQFVT